MRPNQHSAIGIQHFCAPTPNLATPTAAPGGALPAGQTWTYYYYAGSDRIAMRVKSTTDRVYYLLTDHLGSTSVTTDENGAIHAGLRYTAFGETRYPKTAETTPTMRRYTGQLQVEEGLYYYGARFYDSYLNRWIQPDTIIPDQQNIQDWDRYAYGRNNPLKYVDPDGHNPIITGLVGLAVGGAVGGIVYFSTNLRTFDSKEYWTAVGVGAITGGLIASGGILAAEAASAAPIAQGVLSTLSGVATGAGAGGAASGVSYMVTHSNTFETLPFAVNTSGGAIVGGVSGAFPATGWGLVGKGAANQLGGGLLYIANSSINGQPISKEGLTVAVGMGTVSGALDMGLSSYLYNTGVTCLPAYSTNLNKEIGKQAAKYATGGTITGGVTGLAVTSGVNYGMSVVEPWIRKATERWVHGF